MGDFLNGTISNQIYFVYGMIGVVLFLIIALLIVDHKEKQEAKNKLNAKGNKKKERELIEEEELDFVPSDIKPVELTRVEEKKPEKEIMEKEFTKEPTPAITENDLMDIIPAKEEKQPVINQNKKEEIELTPKEEPVEEIVYVEDDPELEKTQAQLELQRLTAELEKAAEEEKAIDLTHFEQEQEEEAIISMEELLKKGDELYDKNEVTQYMDEGNEPINLEELEKSFIVETEPINIEPNQEVSPVMNMVEAVSPTVIEMNDFLQPEEQMNLQEVRETKFKSTPFISPVFGLQPERVERVQKPVQIETPIEKPKVVEEIEEVPVVLPHPDQIALEQTASLEKFDEEIRKTNEFLHQLKELQKNLQ